MGIYEVDELVFRIDPVEPLAWAEFLRDGTWEQVFVTAEDVRGLHGVRELSTQEIEGLGLVDA